MSRKRLFTAVVLMAAALTGVLLAQTSSHHKASVSTGARLPSTAFAALETIDPERIRAHVRFLSHDLLEGRGTGQRGGDIAAEYMATQFAIYGLKPAGDNGTYMQKIAFDGIATQDDSTLSLVLNSGTPLDLIYRKEFV